MAYQDDFRKRVLEALKAKNLAVDISQEATQQAIVEEVQNVAKQDSRPMSPEEMKQVLQDVSRQLAAEQQQFSAQSTDFVAFKDQLAGGGPTGPGGSYSGGGIAASTANKDIMIIPANGGLGAAGSATSVNSLSQIDFKHIANPNAYGVFDPNEVKSSLFNWAERITGNTFDTPVLGLGGAWGGVSYAPTAQWGIGGSQGSGVGGSINTDRGFGQIIFFKPATSTIYASLFNDVGLDTSFTNGNLTITGYSPAIPGAFPSAGFAVSFGGIGGSGDLNILGAASGTQANTIRFASPLTVLNSTVTDTLILGQSSTGIAVSQWFVGGTGQTPNAYVLATAASSYSLGDIFYASGTGHTTLARLPIGANNTYLSSNGTAPFWTNTISANTVSVNPATGSTNVYPLLNNIAGAGSAVSTDVDFFVNPAANILYYASGSIYAGTSVSSPIFTSSADVDVRPGANSTTGIQLANLAGQAVLNVDTSNNRVSIGSNVTGGTYTLDVSGDTNISTGSVYRINGTSVLSSNTLGTGVVTSSLTAVGTISTGTWSATAITSFYGGTGFVTYTTGDLLVGAGATLSKLGIGTVNQVLLSNGTTAIWSAATGLTVGTANQLTTAQTNIATALYPLFANSTTGSIGASIDTDIFYNAAGNILTVQSVYSGTALSSPIFTSSADVDVRPGANSTTGIQLANLAGQPVLNVDTTNSRVSIGSNVAAPTYTLDVSGDTNISTGSVYRINGTSVLSSNTLGTGVVTSSLTTVGTIGTGIWQGTAVGTTYGGTGSNLGSATGSSNKIIVTGTSQSGYAATLIDGANSGYLLAANGNGSAPSFVNTTSAAFTFSSGTLTINNAAITTGTITGVPGSANDIVNKAYADSISGGLDVHGSARLTTIAAIGGSYRQSGTAGTLSGLGDYIIATTPNALIGSDAGWDTVGIALTNGQRVLVKDGVTGGYASGTGNFGAYPTTYGGFAASWVANGIYEVRSYGGAATSGWLLVRATDTDNQAGVQELTGGTFLFIEEGSTFADHAFVCSNDTTSNGPIGFGVTQIAWTLFAGGNTLIPGQGLVESGNNLALLFNLVQANSISGSSFLSRGFTLGGTRAASLGSSSLVSLTVTGASDTIVATNTFTANTTGFTLTGGQTTTNLVVAGVAANNTITGAADGWTHAGGTTSRTLTVTGSDITLTGGGFTLTLGSNSTASFNGQTLTISASTGNVTFTGTANNATVQNIVTSGTAQYQLSTATSTFAAGDMYYNSGATFSAMTRLVLGSGAGSSVLVRSDTAPVWGTIQLGSANFVSGTLGINNGGTNSTTTPTSGAVAYGTGTAYAFTLAGTGDSVLISNGTIPIWSSVNLASTNAVRGTLAITNGGTNTTTTPTSGAVAYGTGTAYAFTLAGTGDSVLISNGTIPIFSSVNLASTNAVRGTLAITNGGTNTTTTPTSGAVAYGTGTAYAFTLAGTGDSVLISNGTIPIFSSINLASTSAVRGTLAIANGGTNATASNYTTNGVVIYDGTRLTSATGLTMTGGVGLSVTGTVAASGGFFIGANSLVTSVTPSGGSAIYGGVGISVLNTNPAGALSITGFGQTVVINGPGTGITGTGAVTQVAYFNATRELTGNAGLVYSPTAATGIGLSVNINATSGTILRLNSAQSFTSGLLLDVDNNSTAAFTVDFKGLATHTAASGNTVLVASGGRTILSAATANYATVNLPSSSGTNPGSGNTQVGDLWFNGTNLYFRRDATTNFDLLVGSVSGSGTVNRVAKWSTASALTDSNISDAGFGMTITSTSSIATVGSGSTSLLTLQTLLADNSLTDRYFVRGVTSTGTRLFSIDTAGNLRATTKSFDIPHPTKEGMRLVYGVLEGPEHGVYHRGTVEGKGIIKVELPEYWHKLVGDQYTIQLTPWGNYNVSIDSKTENYFTIQLVGDFISRKFKNIKVDYIVHGSRLDAPLDIEQ